MLQRSTTRNQIIKGRRIMEKVLKAFKIILYVLLFALAITFVVCLFAIPQETKEFVKLAIEFINKPLPIVGISIATGGFLLWKIIDCTPIGRKGYNAIKEDFKKEQDKINGYKQVAEEKLDEVKKLANEQIAILSHYSQQIDNLCDNLVKVCETSPNAKIKAIGEEIKGKQGAIKEDLQDKLENNELAKKVESTKYDLETILKELQELKEKVYGQEQKDN